MIMLQGEAEGEGYALITSDGAGPSHADDDQHCLQEDTKAARDAAKAQNKECHAGSEGKDREV
jgi:hypothetical protein